MSHSNLFKDFTRGGQTALHAVRMLLQVTKNLLRISVLFILVFNVIWFFVNTTSFERKTAISWGIATFFNDIGEGERTVKVSLPQGSSISIQSSRFISNPSTIIFINDIEKRFYKGLMWSLMICLGFSLLVILTLSISGARKRQHRFKRGSQIVEPDKLKRLIKKNKQQAEYTLADIPLIKDSETKHLMINGSTGTGKTVAINELLDQIRAKKQRAVIYDKMGTFVSHYYREGKDVILNPLDERCPNWDIWLEGNSSAYFNMLANALIPSSSNNSDKIWVDSARTLFSAVAEKLYLEKHADLNALLSLLLTSNIQRLSEFVKNTPAEPLINQEAIKFSLSVVSTLTPALSPLRYCANHQEQIPFSIKGWIENDESDSWLFVTSKSNQHSTLKPLISAWLEIATNHLLSLNPDKNRRIWTILDELPSLHKIPSLFSALAESRQFGGCMVLASQSMSQLRDIYGRDGAESLSGLCNTRLFFRSPDADTANWIANSLGKTEVDETREGLSYGAHEIRDGVSIHSQTQLKQIVLPSEIPRLPDLHAFLRLPGDWPITKVKFTPKNRQQYAESFIEKTILINTQAKEEPKFDNKNSLSISPAQNNQFKVTEPI